jgi:tetratricopeptide (TPR) repeat protein
MNFIRLPYLFIIYTVLSLLIFTACGTKNKKGQDTESYVAASADTTADVKTIVAKVNVLVAANKLEDAIALVAVNLHRFTGVEKARLITEQGNAYYLKDDSENAISDYLTAAEIEPDSTAYLFNVARTYENMESLNNATIFAKKILDLKTATDSDKAFAQSLIDRCDRFHTGH